MADDRLIFDMNANDMQRSYMLGLNECVVQCLAGLLCLKYMAGEVAAGETLASGRNI